MTRSSIYLPVATLFQVHFWWLNYYTYTPPLATCDGLDQVHLIIQHTNNGALHAATMYYNPEAALYCPPPPEVTE